jgi:hypothetical protein
MSMNSVRPYALVLFSLGSLACGPTDQGDDELGESSGDDVDDTVDIDGTGIETGTETDTDTTETTTTTGDPTFEMLCLDGCTHFLDCAPTEFAELYADVAACESACLALYAECTQEASEYFYCFLGLQCAQVLVAVTEGPEMTRCGAAYTAANMACGI